MQTREGNPGQVLILAPVYEDWGAARMLLHQLDLELARAGLPARVLLVDDGSTRPCPADWAEYVPSWLEGVDVLTLRRNVGHQRAIAIGLAYVEAHVSCDLVVVMDSDGEDAPGDIPALVAAAGTRPSRRIVFAERQKRSEGLVFRLFYLLYRQAYRLLTGRQMRVGNFSTIPHELLCRVVVISEIWVHYASGLHRSRLPCAQVATSRGKRLHGESRMSFVNLVTHGLSAIAVHADAMGTRLMVATGLATLLLLVPISAVLVIRFATTLAIPGWATTTAGILLLLLMQGVMLSVFFAFIVLNARNSYSFLPSRDYGHFVLSFRTACSRAAKDESEARRLMGSP
jgi:hypothetical protein